MARGLCWNLCHLFCVKEDITLMGYNAIHANLATSPGIFFFFQSQAPDAVAGALSAAKILRELSHQETEAEEVAAMKDLATHFENLAIGENWKKG